MTDKDIHKSAFSAVLQPDTAIEEDIHQIALGKYKRPVVRPQSRPHMTGVSSSNRADTALEERLGLQ